MRRLYAFLAGGAAANSMWWVGEQDYALVAINIAVCLWALWRAAR